MGYLVRDENGVLIGKLSDGMTNHFMPQLVGDWEKHNTTNSDAKQRFTITEACYIGSADYLQIYLKEGSYIVKANG